jgi:hypothetical protein
VVSRKNGFTDAIENEPYCDDREVIAAKDIFRWGLNRFIFFHDVKN